MARRKAASAAAPAQPPRPEGALVWLHATNAERLLALCDVGARLKALRPDLSVMASWDAGVEALSRAEGFDIELGELQGNGTAARGVMAHWRPDVCVWAGGGVSRGLMQELSAQGAGALLADLGPEEMPGRKSRWLPDQRRGIFEGFAAILTPSMEVRAALRRAGIAREKVRLTGPLRISAKPPDCSDDELANMQGALGSRPVWLAAHASLDELPAIAAAHRKSMQLLHRLLLILSLEDPRDLPKARDFLRDAGMQSADWEAGDEPDEFTQILLADGDDIGLWYRLAPVTLMCGSLDAAGGGQNPLDAAALGSAVLYGPGTGSHGELYGRLAEAGAAEAVSDADTIAGSVVRVSAPDKAAEMALAGWQVVTEGAVVTDQLVDEIQDMLDKRGGGNESA